MRVELQGCQWQISLKFRLSPFEVHWFVHAFQLSAIYVRDLIELLEGCGELPILPQTGRIWESMLGWFYHNQSLHDFQQKLYTSGVPEPIRRFNAGVGWISGALIGGAGTGAQGCPVRCRRNAFWATQQPSAAFGLTWRVISILHHFGRQVCSLPALQLITFTTLVSRKPYKMFSSLVSRTSCLFNEELNFCVGIVWTTRTFSCSGWIWKKGKCSVTLDVWTLLLSLGLTEAHGLWVFSKLFIGMLCLTGVCWV